MEIKEINSLDEVINHEKNILGIKIISDDHRDPLLLVETQYGSENNTFEFLVINQYTIIRNSSLPKYIPFQIERDKIKITSNYEISYYTKETKNFTIKNGDKVNLRSFSEELVGKKIFIWDVEIKKSNDIFKNSILVSKQLLIDVIYTCHPYDRFIAYHDPVKPKLHILPDDKIWKVKFELTIKL